MSEKGMTVLVKKNLLKGMKSVHLKKCTDCLAGKQHRVAFKGLPPLKKPQLLDLVHSDVCKMSVRSIGGAKYFVTFIDDFSRKVWAFPLKSKDQVLSVLSNSKPQLREKLRIKSSPFALTMEENTLGCLMHIAKSKGLGTNSHLQRHHS